MTADVRPAAVYCRISDPAVLTAWAQVPLQERRRRVVESLERVVVNPTLRRGGSFDADRVDLISR